MQKSNNRLRYILITVSVLLGITAVGLMAFFASKPPAQQHTSEFLQKIALTNDYEALKEQNDFEQNTALFSSVDLEAVSQLPDYPTGCEATVAVMLLKKCGVPVTLADFIDNFLYAEPVGTSEGRMYGPDPAKAFAGDPSSVNGYGCFAPVIVEALQNYLESDSPCEVRNLTGASLSDLTAYLSADVPVAVWITADFKPAEDFLRWWSKDGEESYLYPKAQHCVVLTGYGSFTGKNLQEGSGYGCTFLDPVTTEKRTVDAATFEESYNSLGSQAVVVISQETITVRSE